MIINWSVPYIDKNSCEDVICHSTDGEEILRKTFKRANKLRYIYRDDLSAIDKIFVDIALKAQSLMNDPSYLISLKDLFIDGDGTTIPCDEYRPVRAQNYYEDADGNQISRDKYFDEWLGLPQMVKTYTDPNIIKFTEAQRPLSDEQVILLNRFVNSVIELQNSSLCIQHNAFSLECSGSQFHLKENISEEQYKASIISFRKLYMQREPANFKKAVNILRDKRFMPDCVVAVINKANTQYDNLLNQKVNEYKINFQQDEQTRDTLGDRKCADLITAMFNVDSIHQGTDETLALMREIEQVIPDPAVRKFLLWGLLLDLQYPIAVVAKLACHVLDILGKLKKSLPKANISNAQHLLHIYIVNKVYELAEVIWNENGRNTPSMLFFRDTAFTKIVKRFALNRDLFKDLLPPLDYRQVLEDKKSFDNISNVERK